MSKVRWNRNKCAYSDETDETKNWLKNITGINLVQLLNTENMLKLRDDADGVENDIIVSE